jgi:hypothetical protein
MCTTHVSSYSYICVLILLHMCPHTPTYVSSYSYICVLVLLHMCPHTPTYVSSYSYICVLILLHMCPHTATHCYTCVLILYRRGDSASLARPRRQYLSSSQCPSRTSGGASLTRPRSQYLSRSQCLSSRCRLWDGQASGVAMQKNN